MTLYKAALFFFPSVKVFLVILWISILILLYILKIGNTTGFITQASVVKYL